jgi:hypothetical protein
MKCCTCDFVIAKGLVSIPQGEQCPIKPTAPFLRATMPLGHFDKTSPFDREDKMGVLYNTPHHLKFWRSKCHASAVRNQLPSTVYLEGWALYCKEMMAENGFFYSPELQLWQLKNAIWRAVLRRV